MGGGPLGGLIFGRSGPFGYPGGTGGGGGPVYGRSRTQSAGTAEIARQSGGDSMRVDEAAALETTLTRLRQRYTLHFNLPEGVQPGEERQVEVQLADAARRRYPGSEVRYRRVFMKDEGNADPVMISRTPTTSSRPAVRSEESTSSDPTTRRKRVPVNEDGTRIGGWRREGDVEPQASAPQDPASSPLTPAPAVQQTAEPEAKPTGGWRRVKPGEEP